MAAAVLGAEDGSSPTPAQNVEAALRTASSPESLYACTRASDVQRHVEAEDGVVETAFARLHGAISIAQPEATPCAMMQAGWWNYELCWGRYIRQFHIENHRVAAEFILGLGPKSLARADRVMNRVTQYVDGQRTMQQQVTAEREGATWRAMQRTHAPKIVEALGGPGNGALRCSRWLDAHDMQLRFQVEASAQAGNRPPARAHPSGLTSRVVESVSGESPAIATLMPGGSVCDKSGLPRRTLVVLSCEHEQSHYLAFNITEDAECSYVAFVTGAAVCAVLDGSELPMPSAVGKSPSPAPQAKKAPTGTAAKPSGSQSPTSKAAQKLKESRPQPPRETSDEPPYEDTETAAPAAADPNRIAPSHYKVGDKRPPTPAEGDSDDGTAPSKKKPATVPGKDSDDELDEWDGAPLYEGSMIFGLMG